MQQLTTTWLASGSLPAPADVIFIRMVSGCGEAHPGAGSTGHDPCHSRRGTAPLSGRPGAAAQGPARPSPASWLRTAPALRPRPAASLRRSSPALAPSLVPALYGVAPAPRLPKPLAGHSKLTDLLGRCRRRRRCRHLGPPQPALALWHGGGAHTLDGHALPRPHHAPERNPEWARACEGSDPWRLVPRDHESPAGCMGVARISGASSISSKTCLYINSLSWDSVPS